MSLQDAIQLGREFLNNMKSLQKMYVNSGMDAQITDQARKILKTAQNNLASMREDSIRGPAWKLLQIPKQDVAVLNRMLQWLRNSCNQETFEKYQFPNVKGEPLSLTLTDIAEEVKEKISAIKAEIKKMFPE